MGFEPAVLDDRYSLPINTALRSDRLHSPNRDERLSGGYGHDDLVRDRNGRVVRSVISRGRQLRQGLAALWGTTHPPKRKNFCPKRRATDSTISGVKTISFA